MWTKIELLEAKLISQKGYQDKIAMIAKGFFTGGFVFGLIKVAAAYGSRSFE